MRVWSYLAVGFAAAVGVASCDVSAFGNLENVGSHRDVEGASADRSVTLPAKAVEELGAHRLSGASLTSALGSPATNLFIPPSQRGVPVGPPVSP